MTLEQSLQAVLDQHGLTSLTISAQRYSSGQFGFAIYAQRAGKCAQAIGDTINECVGQAVGEVLQHDPIVIEGVLA